LWARSYSVESVSRSRPSQVAADLILSVHVCVTESRDFETVRLNGGFTRGVAESFNLEYSSNTCKRSFVVVSRQHRRARSTTAVSVGRWIMLLHTHTHTHTLGWPLSDWFIHSRPGRLVFAGLSSCCLFNNAAHLSRNTFALSAPVWPAERGGGVTSSLAVISLPLSLPPLLPPPLPPPPLPPPLHFKPPSLPTQSVCLHDGIIRILL